MDPPDVTTTLSSAFRRLRWPIFESIQNIRVFGNSGNWKLDKLETLPFDGHSIATQAATEVPFHQITFDIDTLRDYAQVERAFEMPQPLSVRRADNGIVTVGDVVEQLSAYLLIHKDAILQSKLHLISFKFPGSDEVPPDTRVFFSGFEWNGTIEAGAEEIAVLLWANGEFGDTVEKLWGPG
jgi:hypothetical protein